jgi:hypothetical protein
VVPLGGRMSLLRSVVNDDCVRGALAVVDFLASSIV